MLKNRPYVTVALIWLVWAVIIFSFQAIADWRYQPNRPDRALDWTPDWTARNSQRGNIYLTEPFMNHQVSMDSEYYLSIAVNGYDDPDARTTNPIPGYGKIPLNYAFFPLYPYATRAVAVPLSVLGMNPVATATLAGTIVSLLGTLGAVIALYDLVKDSLGNDGGLRTIFYLLIFPTGFFLAQVYTEGLFLGLAFGCLALIRRKQLLWASVLAGLAVLTKGIGVALLAPLGLAWLEIAWAWWQGRSAVPAADESTPTLVKANLQKVIVNGLYLLIPVAAYLLWHFTLGDKAFQVEHAWFGRGIFNFKALGDGLEKMFNSFRDTSNTQMSIYYAMELVSAILAFAASLWALRLYPGIALFSLFSLILTTTGSSPQSIIRYVLAAPAFFIILARLGRNAVFDRSWTTLCLLLAGMQIALFTFDMWVA